MYLRRARCSGSKRSSCQKICMSSEKSADLHRCGMKGAFFEISVWLIWTLPVSASFCGYSFVLSMTNSPSFRKLLTLETARLHTTRQASHSCMVPSVTKSLNILDDQPWAKLIHRKTLTLQKTFPVQGYLRDMDSEWTISSSKFFGVPRKLVLRS